jgi:GNAT superfamily N-acetyltransferase
MAAGASTGSWGRITTAETALRTGRALAEQVQDGRAGLLAYRGDVAVGWARFTPRSELEWLTTRFAKYDFGAGDPWSLSCFFVASHARGEGVMTALVDFVARWGRDHDVAVEGYPIDPTVDHATRNRFPGVLSTFLRAGFVEQGRLARDRVVVRSEVR